MKPSGPLFLADLADAGEITERLTAHGMSVATAADKADLFAQAVGALLDADVADDAPLRAFYVPGRIEVLGKHTDYAGGSSILAAAERGFCLVAAPRDDATVRILDAVFGEEAELAIQGDLAPTVGHWSNYPMTVARRLARNFPGPLRGAEIGLAGDLPPAAGMSSSSALMVATFFALSAVNQLPARPEYRRNIDSRLALAEYLGTVENGQSFRGLAGDHGVGTFGGSEDHTAMLTCKPGALSQYAYCPVRFERLLPMPEGHVFAIAASGVVAEKTGQAMEKYNRASNLARLAAEAWRQATGRDDPHLAAAIVSEPGAAGRIREALAAAEVEGFTCGEIVNRFEHFCAENQEIIPAAGDALLIGDLDEFGRQVDRSQQLTESLLGNQVPETIHLARSARELGAAAASAFGAGFGGSVWALIAAAAADEFLTRWSEDYARTYPTPAENAVFFLTGAGPGAFEVK